MRSWRVTAARATAHNLRVSECVWYVCDCVLFHGGTVGGTHAWRWRWLRLCGARRNVLQLRAAAGCVGAWPIAPESTLSARTQTSPGRQEEEPVTALPERRRRHGWLRLVTRSATATTTSAITTPSAMPLLSTSGALSCCCCVGAGCGGAAVASATGMGGCTSATAAAAAASVCGPGSTGGAGGRPMAARMPPSHLAVTMPHAARASSVHASAPLMAASVCRSAAQNGWKCDAWMPSPVWLQLLGMGEASGLQRVANHESPACSCYVLAAQVPQGAGVRLPRWRVQLVYQLHARRAVDGGFAVWASGRDGAERRTGHNLHCSWLAGSGCRRCRCRRLQTCMWVAKYWADVCTVNQLHHTTTLLHAQSCRVRREGHKLPEVHACGVFSQPKHLHRGACCGCGACPSIWRRWNGSHVNQRATAPYRSPGRLNCRQLRCRQPAPSHGTRIGGRRHVQRHLGEKNRCVLCLPHPRQVIDNKIK